MRRNLLSLFSVLLVLVLVSCATETDPTGVKGVWKASDGDSSYQFIFTSDGAYSLESYSEDYLDYVEFGNFESDGTCIYTDDGSSYSFVREGKDLLIDINGESMTFKRVSGIARNNTSASKLHGVWDGSFGRIGFLSNGTFVSSGVSCILSEYEADAESIRIDGTACQYMILNSRLYFRNEDGMFGYSDSLLFDRASSTGEDQTSFSILVNNNPWHLIDMNDGDDHYVYSFNSNGRYTMKYFNDYNSDTSDSSGSFSYEGHTVSLSDDGDLAYVIVDLFPFMFSI